MYRLVRAWKVWRNKNKYKNSPESIKQSIYEIITTKLFKQPQECLRALDEFEGIVSYDYDSKGNFEAVLASGTKIKVCVTLTTIEI